MTSLLPRRRWALVLMLGAGGCAAPVAGGRYPTLLPRAVETRGEAEAVAEPAVATPDPATDAAIARLRHTLTETTTAFSAVAAAAERAATAAKGDAVGGERWIAAQAALADLDALRATTSATLTDIDDLAAARLGEGKPPYPALEVLQGEAQAASDDQAARIAALQARLPAAT